VSDWAIIFDVDGVLLELTRAEEELFFQPFAKRIDATQLSRDWNSYKIRNDEEIVKEIVARYRLPPQETDVITAEYLALLESELAGSMKSVPIAGARELLAAFAPHARLGIATANFRKAAELRLSRAGMWTPVSGLAHGADGGGHKANILGRAIAASGLPPERVIFIGDNVNDVVAGQHNKAHFIGFSQDVARRAKLVQAGARLLAVDHAETAGYIRAILSA
jgi:HAD superfamily hydrolase (TIGR01549 family)